MAKFTSEQIRNICFLGHGGSGKTTLNEAMLFLAKHTDRMGKASEGNSVSELVKKNRSYRRFADVAVTEEELRYFVNSARLSASAANRQRLRFVLVSDKKTVAEVFDCLKFAAFLKDWSGPEEGERPAAYIVIMSEGELDINLAIDIGIAAQSILLTATETGVGGCMFRSYNSNRLAEILGREGYTPKLVIALGVPSENVEIVAPKDGDLKYYRDEKGNHLVPKLSLDELII